LSAIVTGFTGMCLGRAICSRRNTRAPEYPLSRVQGETDDADETSATEHRFRQMERLPDRRCADASPFTGERRT
jgi:hypothetical protein